FARSFEGARRGKTSRGARPHRVASASRPGDGQPDGASTSSRGPNPSRHGNAAALTGPLGGVRGVAGGNGLRYVSRGRPEARLDRHDARAGFGTNGSGCRHAGGGRGAVDLGLATFRGLPDSGALTRVAPEGAQSH